MSHAAPESPRPAAPTRLTAVRLAAALPVPVLDVVVDGAERAVVALEILEPGGSAGAEAGDLALLVGSDSPAAALALVNASAAAAGVVLRRSAAHDPSVVAACRELGATLLALADDATWSQALGLLRATLDQAGRAGEGEDPYADLFDLADRVGALLDAPVTVEDAQSRVLAYSQGQHDVDPARTSTIVGRRVPRPVRDHFRARGVFRHLATSDEPILVPAGEDGIRPRFVVPVRAGGEWLGSMWAVLDGPVGADQVEQVRVAAQVVALHLLRLRAHTELHHRVLTARLRGLLSGQPGIRPDALGPGPWRVVALFGPHDGLAPEDQLATWSGTLRRRGWRQPLLADLESTVHAVVTATGDGPGSWAWLARTCASESLRVDGLGALAGEAVELPEDLPHSRAQSAELLLLPDPPGQGTVEEHWAALVGERARRAVPGPRLPTPVGTLVEHDAAHRTAYVATLLAVLDHWGDPHRAAAGLGVHANTVRNRLTRLLEVSGLDLDDPDQRLAAWLECRRAGGTAQRTMSSQPSAR